MHSHHPTKGGGGCQRHSDSAPAGMRASQVLGKTGETRSSSRSRSGAMMSSMDMEPAAVLVPGRRAVHASRVVRAVPALPRTSPVASGARRLSHPTSSDRMMTWPCQASGDHSEGRRTAEVCPSCSAGMHRPHRARAWLVHRESPGRLGRLGAGCQA